MNEELDQPNDTEALGIVTKAFEASKRDQQGAFTLFRDLYRLWRFYKAKGSSVKIFDPIGFTITIGLLSKMFVKPPQVLAAAKVQKMPQPRNAQEMVQQYQMKQQLDEAVEQVKSLLEQQLDNPDLEEPMDEEFISFITEMLICGTAVGKVCWDTKFITQFEEQPSMQEFQDEMGQIQQQPVMDEMGQPVMERQRVEKKGFDDPIFEHIPIENFYKQPGAKTISKSKYVIYEKFVDLDELLEDIKSSGEYASYRNIDQVVADFYSKGDRSGVTNARGVRGTGNSTEKYKDKVHLLEYWEDDRLIVVANESVVIRDEDNPFDHGRKPFVAMSYVKVPHEFYGIGALEPIVDLHKAVNISLTQRLEYVSNLLNQQFLVINNADLNEDEIIEQYPIIHTNSKDSVIPIQKGTVGQDAFVSGNELIAEIERGTGFSGYAGGGTSAPQDKTGGTMGGIQMIIQEASTRFDLTLKRFEKNVLRFIARMFLDLDKQYFPSTEGKLIKLSGGQGIQFGEITKEVLENIDMYIGIAPGSVGFIDKQQKYNNFKTWMNDAVAMAPNFDLDLALKESAQYLDIDTPERFLKVDPDGRPVLNVMAMAKQAKEQGANQERSNKENMNKERNMMRGNNEGK